MWNSLGITYEMQLVLHMKLSGCYPRVKFSWCHIWNSAGITYEIQLVLHMKWSGCHSHVKYSQCHMWNAAGSDFIWDFGKLRFPLHLGNFFQRFWENNPQNTQNWENIGLFLIGNGACIRPQKWPNKFTGWCHMWNAAGIIWNAVGVTCEIQLMWHVKFRWCHMQNAVGGTCEMQRMQWMSLTYRGCHEWNMWNTEAVAAENRGCH